LGVQKGQQAIESILKINRLQNEKVSKEKMTATV